MAETKISRCTDDVLTLASDLIDEHHEHLQLARILWLFTDAKRSRSNRVVLGTAGRTTVLLKHLTAWMSSDGKSQADFIVQLDEKRWKTMLATQKAALIDSCLCRMQWRETVNERSGKVTGRWTTVGPDIEEFSAVLERHGAWLPEQARLVKIIREGHQLRLDESELRNGLSGETSSSSTTNDEPKAERVTTVEADGIVASTELVESESAVGDDAVAVTNGHAHPSDHDVEDPAVTESWKTANGIGTSDIEIHRRRRGTRSSEQVGALP